jgi:hypothetical protein
LRGKDLDSSFDGGNAEAVWLWLEDAWRVFSNLGSSHFSVKVVRSQKTTLRAVEKGPGGNRFLSLLWILLARSLAFPRLAPWAAIFRRFAGDLKQHKARG